MCKYIITHNLNKHLQFFEIFFDQRIKPKIFALNFHVWLGKFIIICVELINNSVSSRHDGGKNFLNLIAN